MSKKSLEDIKSEMAVPPIPQQRPKDGKSHRARNRIRLEITVPQAQWLLEQLEKSMEEKGIKSVEFRPLYTLYSNLVIQVEKMTTKA